MQTAVTEHLSTIPPPHLRVSHNVLANKGGVVRSSAHWPLTLPRPFTYHTIPLSWHQTHCLHR